MEGRLVAYPGPPLTKHLISATLVRTGTGPAGPFQAFWAFRGRGEAIRGPPGHAVQELTLDEHYILSSSRSTTQHPLACGPGPRQ